MRRLRNPGLVRLTRHRMHRWQCLIRHRMHRWQCLIRHRMHRWQCLIRYWGLPSNRSGTATLWLGDQSN